MRFKLYLVPFKHRKSNIRAVIRYPFKIRQHIVDDKSARNSAFRFCEPFDMPSPKLLCQHVNYLFKRLDRSRFFRRVLTKSAYDSICHLPNGGDKHIHFPSPRFREFLFFLIELLRAFGDIPCVISETFKLRYRAQQQKNIPAVAVRQLAGTEPCKVAL